MSRRRRAGWRAGALAAAVALLAPAVPAAAATQKVAATSDVFVPADVTIAAGDTVTWDNSGGLHNVHFDDGSFDMPASPDTSAWSVSRTFGTAGVFRYYCEAHGEPGGVGMAGAVYVTAAPVPQPPSPSPSPSPSGEPVFADKTAPLLRVSGAKRQRVLRQRSLYVLARVDEPSLVVVRARVAIPRTGRSLRARTVSKRVAARTTTRFGLVFSRQKLRRFSRTLRRHRRLVARVTITATDQAGNRTSSRRRVTLRR